MGSKASSEHLNKRLKKYLFFTFILENALEFWFALLLSVFVPVFRITVLVVMKVGGFVVLSIAVAVFALLMCEKRPREGIEHVGFSRNRILSIVPSNVLKGLKARRLPIMTLLRSWTSFTYVRFRDILKENL